MIDLRPVCGRRTRACVNDAFGFMALVTALRSTTVRVRWCPACPIFCLSSGVGAHPPTRVRSSSSCACNRRGKPAVMDREHPSQPKEKAREPSSNVGAIVVGSLVGAVGLALLIAAVVATIQMRRQKRMV